MKWGKPLAEPSFRLGKYWNYTAHLEGSSPSELLGQKLIRLLYIAGYLDGEGCFRWCKTVSVSVTNTYPYTLKLLQKCFGGTIRTKRARNAKWRTAYEWYVSGESAAQCLRSVYPFLHEKAEQAATLLDIPKYPTKSVRRARLEKRLRDLKRVDYSTQRLHQEDKNEKANPYITN